MVCQVTSNITAEGVWTYVCVRITCYMLYSNMHGILKESAAVLCSHPQFLMTTNSLSTCCESSGRALSDSGVSASAPASVYCPVYESRLLATARHELSSAAALGVYGNPYTNSQGYGNYVTYGTDASAFYSLVSFSCTLSFQSITISQLIRACEA